MQKENWILNIISLLKLSSQVGLLKQNCPAPTAQAFVLGHFQPSKLDQGSKFKVDLCSWVGRVQNYSKKFHLIAYLPSLLSPSICAILHNSVWFIGLQQLILDLKLEFLVYLSLIQYSASVSSVVWSLLTLFSLFLIEVLIFDLLHHNLSSCWSKYFWIVVTCLFEYWNQLVKVWLRFGQKCLLISTFISCFQSIKHLQCLFFKFDIFPGFRT